MPATIDMPVTTTFNIEGYQIKEYKGIVRGLTLHQPGINLASMTGLKKFFGNRIGTFTKSCEQARDQAYELLIQHAHEVGANAIVGLHYDTSSVIRGTNLTEVFCYGTAVVIEPTQ